MNKVKITVNQENVLKEFNDIWKDKTANERYEVFLQARKMTFESDALKPLTEINEQDFFFMLHGWYEVEQPKLKFEVGDWVYGKVSVIERYYKITEIAVLDSRKICLSYVNDFQESFEKVTEDWKIILLELGREKPELKIGDKFITMRGDLWAVHDPNIVDCSKIKFKYFYPVESRIEFKQ